MDEETVKTIKMATNIGNAIFLLLQILAFIFKSKGIVICMTVFIMLNSFMAFMIGVINKRVNLRKTQ